MSKEKRISLIQEIEQARGSHLISYVTSTRPGLEVHMEMEAIRRIYEHLRPIKDQVKIDLFIHSNGGDGTVPWRLVTLIREYTEDFSVLVPHRAFSSATLTALGADNIVMHPMGMLGPTDPTVRNEFNPVDPVNPGAKLGINVEDVTAYIALIKEDAGITHEDELVQAFNILAEQVHPLALGNVKKFLSQSRMMAKKLLSLHMDNNKDEHKIAEIVDNLTTKLYYHGHPINRKEARYEIGLENIVLPSPEVENLMWDLYLEYERELLIERHFRPSDEFLEKNKNLPTGVQVITPANKAKLVYVESAERTDLRLIEYQLSGEKKEDGTINVLTVVNNERWTTE